MILEAVFKEEEAVPADFGVLTKGEKGDKGDKGDKGEVDYSIVANALKGSASGSAITMTDVSPLEHEIKVKLKGEVTLTYICDLTDNGEGHFTSGNGDYTVSSVADDISPDSGMVYFTDGSYCDCWWGSYLNDYVPSVGDVIRYDENEEIIYLVDGFSGDFSGVTLTKCGKNLVDISQMLNECLMNNGEETFKFAVTDGKKESAKSPVHLEAGTKIFSSIKIIEKNMSAGKDMYFKLFYADGSIEGFNFNRSYVLQKDVRNVSLYSSSSSEGDNVIFKNFQIEHGTTATEFEPFNGAETYKPNEDGMVEGVTSLYPTTTLMTDTEGVTITAEYNKDLNKAFAEIYQKLSALGVAVVNN